MSSDEERRIRQYILDLMRHDEEVKAEILRAAKRKRRHWLANLVIDACSYVLGRVVSDLVERAIDWIIDRYC
jgi:hypothetical protein